MQDGNAENFHFLMQEGGKMRSFHFKGKDKDGLTTVPLMGDRKQTRSKRISPRNEAEISAQHRKEKK